MYSNIAESRNDNRKIFTEMEELVVLSCHLGTSDILSKELTDLLIGTPYLRNTNQQNLERATFLRSKVSSEPTLDDVVPIKKKFLQIFQDETEKAHSGIAQSNMQMSKLAGPYFLLYIMHDEYLLNPEFYICGQRFWNNKVL